MTIDVSPLVSGRLEAFVLLFARVTTILLVAPIYGNRVVPVRVRVLAGLALAVALLPIVPPAPLFRGAGAVALGLALASEVLFGLLIGLLVSVAFFGVLFAGQLVGLQMGFGISNIIDPNSDAQVAVTAEFQSLLFLLVFLTLDGHHLVVAALAKSLGQVPLGGFTLDGRAVEAAMRESGEVFSVALRVGGPVIAFLFVTSLALAAIAKTAPQLNVFNLGFPVQIAGGLVVLLLALPGLRIVFEELTRGMEADVAALLGAR